MLTRSQFLDLYGQFAKAPTALVDSLLAQEWESCSDTLGTSKRNTVHGLRVAIALENHPLSRASRQDEAGESKYQKALDDLLLAHAFANRRVINGRC